jgi:hypothetical protein
MINKIFLTYKTACLYPELVQKQLLINSAITNRGQFSFKEM